MEAANKKKNDPFACIVGAEALVASASAVLAASYLM